MVYDLTYMCNLKKVKIVFNFEMAIFRFLNKRVEWSNSIISLIWQSVCNTLEWKT